MSRTVRILIGLAAALLIGWLWHGPIGEGEAFVAAVEAEANARVSEWEVPGIEVRLDRDPLGRDATLSGSADAFQRRGMGTQPGLVQIAGSVEGVGAVRWDDEPALGLRVPLLVETLALVSLAYLIGLGLGWLLWGRRREGFA